MKRALNSALFLAVLTLGMGGFFLPTAFAAVSVTAATGGSNISADAVSANGGSAWVALSGPTLTEGATGDIGTGTIILNAPAGFNFRTTGNVTVSVTNIGTCGGKTNSPVKIGNPISKTATAITISVTQASSGSCMNSIALSGISVQPTAGTPLATGNITESGTATIPGITGSTNFGTLTEVVGAVSAANSTISATPVSISTDNAEQTTITVTAMDQFSNLISGDAVILSSTGTGNTLTQPATTTDSSGQATGTLSSTKAESKTISATIAGTTITHTASVTFNPGAFDHITLTPSGAQSVAGGSTLAFSAQGYDIHDNAISGLSYSWSVATSTGTGTVDSNGTLTGGKAGTLTVSATSGTITGTSGIITVTNVAPVLSAIGNKTVDENSALQFTVSGTDANGDALTYSASPLPSGATLDAATGVFSWTPDYSQSGTYNPIFSVSDGYLSATETVSIIVNNVNQAPILSTIGSKNGSENSLLKFTVYASDPDGDALTYSASGLPTGASFDAGSATFSWTPDFTQSGNYSVLFSVSDGSLSASENVAVSIKNVDQDDGGVVGGGGGGGFASYNFGPAIASAPIPAPAPAPVQTNIEAPKNNPVNVPSQNPQPSTPQQPANPVTAASSEKPEVNAQNLLASSPESLSSPANGTSAENSSETKTSLFANLSAIMNFNNIVAAVRSGTTAVSNSALSLANFFLSIFSGR